MVTQIILHIHSNSFCRRLKIDTQCCHNLAITFYVAVLTVTVHSSFFPTFDFFLNMLLSALDSIC